MPALSFQKRFVPFVENGTKTHSIRAERKRPFKVGDTCHLFTAMRTEQCRLLGRAPCVKVEAFRLYRAAVWIDGVELEPSEKDALALRDGFRETLPGLRPFNVMLRFWLDTHGHTEFSGHIIHWDWSKREVSA